MANTVFWETTNSASLSPYVAPTAGVITSWSTDPGANGATTVPERFIVVRQGTPNVLVGAGPFENVVQSDQVQTFPTRISVKPGDLIGVSSSTALIHCAITSTNASDVIAFAGNPAGSTFTTDGTAVNVTMAVAASLEPDADGDGFGDETQDKCPNDPNIQTTCPVPKDTTKPAVSASSLSGKLSKGAISFFATAGEAGSGTATATISVPKSTKTVRFKTAKVTLGPGKLTEIKLKLSKKNAAAVRKALAHHKLKAKITLTVKDAAGNQTVKKLTLKLTR